MRKQIISSQSETLFSMEHFGLRLLIFFFNIPFLIKSTSKLKLAGVIPDLLKNQ